MKCFPSHYYHFCFLFLNFATLNLHNLVTTGAKKKKKKRASDRNKITEKSVFWELGGLLLPLLAEAVDLPSHDLYNYDSKTKKVRMKKLFIRK